MEEVIVIVKDLFLEICTFSLSVFASYIGMKIRQLYENKVKDEKKEKIVSNTVAYINQLYVDLEGSEKFNKAKEMILILLKENKLTITEKELDVLIESTVLGFKRGYANE